MEPTRDDAIHPFARFLDLANGLKSVARAGWVRCGVTDAESVADHSFGVALLALMLTPDALDRQRTLALAVVHDLAETITGDITPHDEVGLEEKRAREGAAMEELARLAGSQEIRELWSEYDQSSTPEARFVHELDALEMASQAISYRRSGRLGAEAAAGFLRSARARLHTASLISRYDELVAGL